MSSLPRAVDADGNPLPDDGPATPVLTGDGAGESWASPGAGRSWAGGPTTAAGRRALTIVSVVLAGAVLVPLGLVLVAVLSRAVGVS